MIVGHLTSTHRLPAPIQGALDMLWSVEPGNLGVRIFFVISGFLITGLLLHEYQTTGTVSLRKFYFRRTLRIMPAFYAFLLGLAIATQFGLLTVPGVDLVRAGTYTSNYFETSFPVGHSWSLAVEEQFYLLWPGVIIVLGLRRGFLGAALMLGISPLMRVSAMAFAHWPDNPKSAFECVADALATGCLLARYRADLWAWPTYRRALESRWMAIWPLGLVGLASGATRLGPAFLSLVGVTLINLCIAIGLDRSIRFPLSPLGRLFNAKPVIFIGVLSYSLYLWQQPFLRAAGGIRFPLNLLAIGVMATASHYLVENPFLRLRARLEQRKRGTSLPNLPRRIP